MGLSPAVKSIFKIIPPKIVVMLIITFDGHIVKRH